MLFHSFLFFLFDFALCSTVCRLSNNDVGQCIKKSFCPNLNEVELIYCENGDICCKTFQKIMTPLEQSSANTIEVVIYANQDSLSANQSNTQNSAESTASIPVTPLIGSSVIPLNHSNTLQASDTTLSATPTPTENPKSSISTKSPENNSSIPNLSTATLIQASLPSGLDENLTTSSLPPATNEAQISVSNSTTIQIKITVVAPTDNSKQTPISLTNTNAHLSSQCVNNCSENSDQLSSPTGNSNKSSISEPPPSDIPFISTLNNSLNAIKDVSENITQSCACPLSETINVTQIGDNKTVVIKTDHENIVAEPSGSNKQYSNNESIAISAEELNDATIFFDNKCEMYHSPKVTNFSTNNNTPIVMIYGGKDSEEKEFPHMAALGYGEQSDNEFFCGGSLILENFVLTAAHCLVSKIGPVRYVKLGIVDLFQSSSNNVQILNVMQTFQHEQYNSNTQYHDIALLKLNGSVVITDYVRPICLFSSNNYEDRNIVATGWGKTENEAVSVNLQKVGLELFTQRECQVAYQNVPKEHLPLGIQESIQICAGSHSKNSDTCQGDSGGPIQIRKNNRWYLIGITSVGLQCGIVNSPGVYTRISAYFSWIKERISN